MSVMIKKMEKENGNTFFVAEMNAKEFQVWIGDMIHVVCNNASHKAWGSIGGKWFQTIEQALQNYKSSEAKTIIQAAYDFSKA